MKISTEINSTAKHVGEVRAVELVAAAGFDAYDFSMFAMVSFDWKTDTVKESDRPLANAGYAAFAKAEGDGALSDRWIVMSKLLFAVLGGIIVVPILFFVLRMIGVIIGLLYILGVLAFGVCEYVFLYQTANRFRE